MESHGKKPITYIPGFNWHLTEIIFFLIFDYIFILNPLEVGCVMIKK